MGTMRRREPRPLTPPSNSLVASAARVGKGKLSDITTTNQSRGWQTEAYRMYKTVPEYRYACDWVGSMMSKASLFPSRREEKGRHHPIAEGSPRQFMEDLFNHEDGRIEMLRLIGIHLTIAGECYLVGYDNPDPMSEDPYAWEVVAPHQLKNPAGSSWIINDRTLEVDPDNVLVIRLWKPDPERSVDAISPSRPLLGVLGEIHRLTQHVAAQVDSRLAGAGVFLVPSEMTFPPPPETEAGEDHGGIQHHANDAESLMGVLEEAMSASIADRSNASALVPIVITAPQDAIGAVKHITFWSELDRQAIELRTEAIRRLALGMDMPPEVLTGNADVNHWNAWQADESAIKAHTEPLLKIITSALAQGYLRPMLAAEGMDVEELRLHSVGADTADMRLRPNRSKEAFELYDRGEIGGETLRRETGFTEEDSMSADQLSEWYVRKVAGGSATPEMVSSALGRLGVDIPAAGEDPNESRPTPSLKDHPERGMPDWERSKRNKELRDDVHLPALTAAAEQMVVRALERSGNKLKNRMQVKPALPAAELYTQVNLSGADADFLLDDAWAHVPALAQRYEMDESTLVDALSDYTRTTLLSRSPHTFETFTDYLEKALT